MTHQNELYKIKSKINAARLLFVALLSLMFISICHGHNVVGLLLMGAAVVVLCALTYLHTSRIEYNHRHAKGV